MTGASPAAPADGTLDHVVINVLRRMDEAAELFAALGFRITPRGHHSLGSINHLMMTTGPYLELVGIPETGAQRQDVLDSPFGLNGLVVASRDADATHARLAAVGLAAGPPVAFSRPVTVDGREEAARFRTVRVPADRFPAGRLYHCEHLTPDLVWRPEWLDHPNGFAGIDALTIESPAPEADAHLYAAASGAPAEAAGDVWTLRLGKTRIAIVPGPIARFAALALRFRGLDALEARAAVLPEATWVRHGPDTAELTLPAFGLHLPCRAAP
ncbi:Glyoxalase-like domain-containing protein [Methylobacterium sp. UNC378MF]|uniref:VOC family protein n=1 Tax=Methylobacterium sp. UNC378MF TaxID=1502748 RepID=UPI0008923914|nr:VOC family protein [Methylobacterium sp. UNC378MF]SDA27858.1 Glyoxalase-like domain-containing protein [Methylobacterium sp. UNC378MF]